MILDTVPTFKIAIKRWQYYQEIVFRMNRSLMSFSNNCQLIKIVFDNKTIFSKFVV